jgi:hypothetical protein
MSKMTKVKNIIIFLIVLLFMASNVYCASGWSGMSLKILAHYEKYGWDAVYYTVEGKLPMHKNVKLVGGGQKAIKDGIASEVFGGIEINF